MLIINADSADWIEQALGIEDDVGDGVRSKRASRETGTKSLERIKLLLA